MSMTIAVARMRIAREIQDAEAKLDEALIGQASLLTTMLNVRRETGSAPFEGHDILLRLNKSQQALLSAGGELARVHGRLLQVQEEKGVLDDCPPNKPIAHADCLDKAG